MEKPSLVPWWFLSEAPKSKGKISFPFPFSLLFLSLPSPFLPYPSRVQRVILNWSTKGAKCGLKVPLFLLNRHPFFSIFPKVRSTGPYPTGRPDDQNSWIRILVTRVAKQNIYTICFYFLFLLQTLNIIIINNNNFLFNWIKIIQFYFSTPIP